MSQISMWTCQYCGKDTSNVEYDYLNGYNHLGCALEREQKTNSLYETCIMCGSETTTLKTTHVDFRYGYVDGAGQLCRECYMGENRNLITIEGRIILDTPNNEELGAKVRQMYWDNKK